METGPASPRTARLINDRRAYQLLLERGPLTRGALRRLTGMSWPSVSAMVSRLERAGLVGAVGESGSERRGPNALLYGLVADRVFTVGVEVRFDRLEATVVDALGEPRGSATAPQDDDRAPDEQVGALVTEALEHGQPGSVDPKRLGMVVVGTPGLVDPATGDVGFVASLPSWHSNLREGLGKRLGTQVVVENEVNLVALAEHRLGAARGRQMFALLWLDDGIGLAIVLDGKLHRGMSGGAGEVAYLPLGPERTLQAYVGGPVVRELASGYTSASFAVEAPLSELVHDLVAADPGDVVGQGVAADSTGFTTRLADLVAMGAAGVSAVLDPGLLVLGGGVGRGGGDRLAAAVTARLSELLPSPTTVVPAEVEGNPVVRGAVLVGLDRLVDQVFEGR